MLRYAFLTLSVFLLLRSAAHADEAPDFDRQVAPILAGRCLDCHSGGEPKGGLDLSHAVKARAGGESGLAIEPGKPEASLLWQRIDAAEMPPKHPLPNAERAVIKSWIASGAAWGTDPIDPFRYTSASRAGYDWWSLQPLQGPTSKSHEGIDAIVIGKLTDHGLTPSPPADRRTVIRRVTFDLIGLPPTPEEIASFVNDPVDDDAAYEKVVTRLLNSPHYGERWARHWLDVAHFGESDGFEYDRMRPHAWRYRDWVIGALNSDMPYDEFARLQIAGDVLRPGDEDAIIATGFLVAGAHDSLMPKGEVMQMIMRQDELEDLVSLVSQTFLGLTTNCARCHDHKFDPIRQTDYYRLAAALSGVKRGNRDLAPLDPPKELVARRNQAGSELALINRDWVLHVQLRDAAHAGPAPEPSARWEFDGDLRDSIGNLHGKAEGSAKVEGGRLVLDGKTAFVVTEPLEGDLREKTLEAWVQLSTLDQRGGGVIGVQSPDGDIFDALVFGEKEPRRWVAGSDFFRRTRGIEDAADENDADKRLVHLAAVYQANGQVQLYRDGKPYGKAYKSDGPVTFSSGKAQVVFGMRHAPPGNGKLLAGEIERACLYDRALSADEVAASARSSGIVTEQDLLAAMDDATRARRTRLMEELKRIDDELKNYRERKVFAVTPQPAPVAHLLIRGNVQQKSDPIAPAGLSALVASEPDFGLAPDASDADRRRKLAEWIASEKNPLFARTIVNRLWHYHFGRGLVETPNDLGFSGGRASHPELLDWLAAELIASKWSLKSLHRTIVMSATYRQSSQSRAECLAVDSDNRLLWRYSPRRLDAESLRDAMLSVAGELNSQMGGPSYLDFRPYEHKTTQFYEPIDAEGPDASRRSIYRMWTRGGRSPLLDTFDCPDPSTATPNRAATTTPLQALSLMNNSFTLRMADGVAERVGRERPADVRKQVELAFELTCGRLPTDDELDVSNRFVEQHGLPAFCRVLLNTNGFLYVN